MFQFVTLLQDNEVTYPNISDKSKYVLGHCQNQLKSVRTAGDRKDYAFSKCLINAKEILCVAPLRLVCMAYVMQIFNFTKTLESTSKLLR